GVAFRLFDRLPKEGDKVRYEGYEFIAREVTGLRISKIQVRKIVADEERSEESVDDQSEPIEAVDESPDRQDETTELDPDGDTREQDSAPADDENKKETIDSGGAR
ncbi:MAG: hypothetical protein JAZ05_14755, partial [Candidatus Thiodiazotropha taylori]|nr:hypothetical protein [Candidatus Thiodiazotropha taylori]MCW4293277.1 hypothetical protein [Candidatus Thiodiazotropha taylori]